MLPHFYGVFVLERRVKTMMLIKWLQSKLGKQSKSQKTQGEILADALDWRAGYYSYFSDIPYNPDAPDLWKEGYLYAYERSKRKG